MVEETKETTGTIEEGEITHQGSAAGVAVEVDIDADTSVGFDDNVRGDLVSQDSVSFDIRSFLPLEFEQVCSSFSLAQSRVLLLAHELTEARKALDMERAKNEKLQEEIRVREGGARITGLLEPRARKELRWSNQAVHKVMVPSVPSEGTSEVAQIQFQAHRIQQENAELQRTVEDLSVSLRLAENKARRLEFELLERSDAELDMRLLLHSCMYTMNKHANGTSHRNQYSGGSDSSAKVKRLVEKVKASHAGVDVTDLSVSDVQALLSLLLRRMNAKNTSVPGAAC